MKVFFVGIHNKPDMVPLDSCSRSGKLVDKIIRQLRGHECIKTNLYMDANAMLRRAEGSVKRWAEENGYDAQADIIVTLGGFIRKEFRMAGYREIVSLIHPASVWSNNEKLGYVMRATDKINEAINQKNNQSNNHGK